MKRKLDEISIYNLIVNPNNDRHGELVDEKTAIEELLNTMPSHMKELAKDISKSCEIFNLPLVIPSKKSKYIVCDGNRRITCLKLLNKPELAPTDDWQNFFRKQMEASDKKIPNKIECHIETNQEWIEEYLYRIHTGAQKGVGQIYWNNRAQMYFVERTGKNNKVDLAGFIENALRSNNLIDDTTKVKHTNVARLLSSEEFRSRVGLSVKNNKVIFIKDNYKSLVALKRIFDDLSTGELNLNHLLINENKRKYLNDLEAEGVLPSVHDSIEKEKNENDNTNNKADLSHIDKKNSNPTPKLSPKSTERKTLIRHDVEYQIPTYVHTKRASDIWTELQHNLKFGYHNNAIAVSFRVLLEISLENYIERNKVKDIYPNDKLANKFKKVLEHQKKSKLIDQKTFEALIKFEKKETIFSADTMHKYVHHKSFFPSPTHLTSMWDTLCNFIINCLKS